jgi:hypothetical protein
MTAVRNAALSIAYHPVIVRLTALALAFAWVLLQTDAPFSGGTGV